MAETSPLRIARCQCGALSATRAGEPWRVSLCHCNACKARTGSAFGLQATFRDQQVELAGTPRLFERTGEEGHWVRQYFCADCGTTLLWRIERRAGSVSIAVGCFGTSDFAPPAYEVYAECAMAGIALKISPEPERQ